MDEKTIQSIVSQLTLEEKASLCSGENNWQSKGIERVGIPSIYMTDGPHGLRKDVGDGFGNSVPATCFPTACALASSWDVDLLNKVGEAIGRECQANDVQIILGPGANMKRSPLGGRNFEYFSEDPVLAGELAAALINGIQSQEVGTSLKHFTANNQELERMVGNSEVDERTLREIYFPAFEIAVKKAQPWTVMCAYNKINGVFGAEHRYFLHDVLKKDFGLDGYVISDWGAVNDRPKGVYAGLHLEMPGNGGVNDVKIVEAVKNGELSESRLDEVVATLLKIHFRAYESRRPGTEYDTKVHHKLARKAAADCAVLLKNEDDILPIDPYATKKIAVIGRFAKEPRYQGSGSSQVNPNHLDIPFDEILKLAGNQAIVTYAPGVGKSDEIEESLINEAQRAAQEADVAIIFAGLPESYESEGYDREHINLPPKYNALIEQVSLVQPNVIVVLSNGSAVTMPWANKVKGILEGMLGGQGFGGGIADVLFGNVNPSGKLAETFPQRIEDTPTYLTFPGESLNAIYGEGIYIGYRYYEKKKVKPQFPFGHGLSYTTFNYLNLLLSKNRIKDDETLEVRVTVQNTGSRFGKEVVQLYVRDVESRLSRPIKELKGFKKLALQPRSAETINFELNKRDFSFFDPRLNQWVVEDGTFEILVGTSSKAILLKEEVYVESTTTPVPKLHRLSMVKEFATHPKGKAFYDETVERMMPIFLKTAVDAGDEALESARHFFEAILNDMPLSKLITFSSGEVSEEMLEEVLKEVNAD